VKQFDRKIQEKSSAIDSIKTQLARSRQKILELDKKEGAYLQQLELLEKNIESSEKYLLRLDLTIAEIGVRIGRVKDSLVIVGDALARRQQTMKQRLRSIYKTGMPQPVEILFTSQSMADVLSRIRYFQELGRYDNMLCAAIDSARTVVGEKKRTLEKQQQEYARHKTSKESEIGELEKEKKKRKTVLADVSAEKKAHTAMVKELERAQQELNLIVQKLRKKKKEVEVEVEMGQKVAFEKRKGKLPWPVDGTVAQEYGRIVHPVYKTVIMSNGMDIRAAKGEKVFCVAPGRVDYIGWMRGYGKFIIINHYGGYLTVYAHLESITVTENQVLDFGHEIGLTGETGSLNGVKLHFQIRRESETLNPREWLEKKE